MWSLTEAGIEEALTHLNDNCLSSDITLRIPDWTADTWQQIKTAYASGIGLRESRTQQPIR